MLEKGVGGAQGHRPARGAAAAAQPHQPQLQQHVQRAPAGLDAANGLDLGPGHRLMIGDDGQRLLRGLGQASRLLALLGHQEGQIVGGLETPAVGDAGQPHAAFGVGLLQPRQRRSDIRPLGQPTRQISGAQGFGRREQ